MNFSLKDILNSFNKVTEKENEFTIEIPTIIPIVDENLRDLDSKIPGAPNFRYKEVVKSDTALRLGIENIPNEKQWQCIEKTAKLIVQPVREKFGGIKITSGFRSVQLCIEIGSSRTSNHTRGQAIDFEPVNPKIKLFDILEWIHNNLKYRELIAEFLPSGWIHCAYREGDNSRILKLKDNNHHYKRVNLEYIRKIYG